MRVLWGKGTTDLVPRIRAVERDACIHTFENLGVCGQLVGLRSIVRLVNHGKYVWQEIYLPPQDQGLLSSDALMVTCDFIYLLQGTLDVCVRPYLRR